LDNQAKLKDIPRLPESRLNNLSILKNQQGQGYSLLTLDAICKALKCQPGDFLEYVADDAPEGPTKE